MVGKSTEDEGPGMNRKSAATAGFKTQHPQGFEREEEEPGKAYAAPVDALDQWKCFICDPANVKSRGGKAS